jgi:cyclopropane fatty-acyl-phospholipid synthase-like methyltransferase
MGQSLAGIVNHFEAFTVQYVKTHGEIIQAAQGIDPTEVLNLIGDKAGLSKDDLLLDCGSGVGFPAHYLSERYGCNAVGINITDTQLESSKKYQSESCGFVKHDFNKLEEIVFSPTVITFMEAFCYSQKPHEVIQKAFDILAPGGRLVIKDFYKETKDWSLEYLMAIRDFYKAEFHAAHDFIRWGYDAGFKLKLFEELKLKEPQPVTARFLKEIDNTDPKLCWPKFNTFKPFVMILEKPVAG